MAVSVSRGLRAVPLAAFLLAAALPAAAQEIRYEVSFPNAVHHGAEITLVASGLTRRPALFQMSRP